MKKRNLLIMVVLGLFLIGCSGPYEQSSNGIYTDTDRATLDSNAVQSSNGIYTDTDRAAHNSNVSQSTNGIYSDFDRE